MGEGDRAGAGDPACTYRAMPFQYATCHVANLGRLDGTGFSCHSFMYGFVTLRGGPPVSDNHKTLVLGTQGRLVIPAAMEAAAETPQASGIRKADDDPDSFQ